MFIGIQRYPVPKNVWHQKKKIVRHEKKWENKTHTEAINQSTQTEPFFKNCESLYCTPVTYIILPRNYTSIKIKWGQKHLRGFPGGAVVENLPANAGDMGSSPGPGRSHMLRSGWARASQPLSPHATTTEAHEPRAHALQQERPPWWEACAPQPRLAPTHRS